ncbi:malate synthase G [Microlunatus endophyticus]|uniref:Malate synthase G n=1 Tax=Microlunatus endophyticus TaxID=1716077 RepID=A0A917W5P8_9ACTN|nr:malate synthase G [Microlunatus endophyticus]GGL72601.1 malate synthase G [Microlunatus endophyticus]
MSDTERVEVAGLSVAAGLHRFVEDVALPGSGLESGSFWSGVATIFADLAPRIDRLLADRDEIQAKIDDYHRAAPGQVDEDKYLDFLTDIGYLVDDKGDVRVDTGNVDTEIAEQAGPQLVVPLLNKRYAANAVNARWGSLYDALYGTDAIDQSGDQSPGTDYNPLRGAAVVDRVRDFLDSVAPLADGSHRNATSYAISGGRLAVEQSDNGTVGLADPDQFVGYRGDPAAPESVILLHNRLHLEILIDRRAPIGRDDPAGIKDVLVESAVTTIMDLEDSIAAVDTEDKVLGYTNWLQLMAGTLSAEVTKAGRTFTRRMNPDRDYTAPDGSPATLRGRSLLFVRHVGHHMNTDAILDNAGNQVPEGILDAIMTGLGSLRDLQSRTQLNNSLTGSMYVVKPKMHGPDEVALTADIFAHVEELLGLAPLTIKLGIMDEERRTSANLVASLVPARDRIVFINTGFLDRTGDEIHTSMYAGPVVRKAEMKSQPWITAYEDRNVDIGIRAGLPGRAQIGKGMWAMPDLMADMLEQKVQQPLAGATTAWVPSPTAATLHALHYHQVDVFARQQELASRPPTDRRELLRIPLAARDYTAEERQVEIDNNIQGVLGYVVRWVDQGIGCSKVPDIDDVALMEDRATCRISSQHVANWLLHGLVSRDQVEETLRRMAVKVDEQNSGDPDYRPMAPGYDGEAFLAARALIIEGTAQPNGYTEPILHRYRRQVKDKLITEPVRSAS